MDHDVKNIVNKTTLGPYSFDVFVQGAWTTKKTNKVPKGRRPLQAVSGTGGTRRKRPLAADILKTVPQPPSKKLKNLLANDDENILPVELNTRVTRSGRRLAK